MTNTTRPTLNIDLEEFIHFLDAEVEGTYEEKKEYLELIWQIVCEFAMMGFDIHPVQQAQQKCGKEQKTTSTATHADSDTVESNHTTLVEAFVEGQDQRENKEEDAYA